MSCLVLDSPFTKVEAMVSDVASRKMNIPSIVTSIGMKLIKSSITSRVGYDITKLDPLGVSQNLKMPAAFIRAMQDTLVYPDRIDEYYRKFKGRSKLLISSEFEHNSEREDIVLSQAYQFLL